MVPPASVEFALQYYYRKKKSKVCDWFVTKLTHVV